MKIGPPLFEDSFVDGAGTRWETHHRVINGTEYRFTRTTRADGSRLVTSAVTRGLNIDGHTWVSEDWR